MICFSVLKPAWLLYKVPLAIHYILHLYYPVQLTMSLFWRVYDCRSCCIKRGFSLMKFCHPLIVLCELYGHFILITNKIYVVLIPFDEAYFNICPYHRLREYNLSGINLLMYQLIYLRIYEFQCSLSCNISRHTWEETEQLSFHT